MSLPHQRIRGKLVWVWRVPGSMRPKGTRVILSIFYFNGTSGRGKYTHTEGGDSSLGYSEHSFV
eukprot:1133739-Pelagomonas_calceolata.AAC.1